MLDRPVTRASSLIAVDFQEIFTFITYNSESNFITLPFVAPTVYEIKMSWTALSMIHIPVKYMPKAL